MQSKRSPISAKNNQTSRETNETKTSLRRKWTEISCVFLKLHKSEEIHFRDAAKAVPGFIFNLQQTTPAIDLQHLKENNRVPPILW